jgi:hypothetical protein
MYACSRIAASFKLASPASSTNTDVSVSSLRRAARHKPAVCNSHGQRMHGIMRRSRTPPPEWTSGQQEVDVRAGITRTTDDVVVRLVSSVLYKSEHGGLREVWQLMTRTERRGEEREGAVRCGAPFKRGGSSPFELLFACLDLELLFREDAEAYNFTTGATMEMRIRTANHQVWMLTKRYPLTAISVWASRRLEHCTASTRKESATQPAGWYSFKGRSGLEQRR